MNFKEHGLVKVIDKESAFEGRVGTIVSLFSTAGAATVEFQDCELEDFDLSEIEPVNAFTPAMATGDSVYGVSSCASYEFRVEMFNRALEAYRRQLVRTGMDIYVEYPKAKDYEGSDQ